MSILQWVWSQVLKKMWNGPPLQLGGVVCCCYEGGKLIWLTIQLRKQADFKPDYTI